MLHTSPLAQDTCVSTSLSYCIAMKGCTTSTDTESCPAETPTRFDDNAQRPSYEIVRSIPMTVASLGVFRYNLSDPVCNLFAMEVGYILGLVLTADGGARVGTETQPITTNAPQFKSTVMPGNLSPGDILALSSFELTSSRHLLRAVTVSPLLSRTQLSNPASGDHLITASVVNSITPSGVKDYANVSVVIPITGKLDVYLIDILGFESIPLRIRILPKSPVEFLPLTHQKPPSMQCFIHTCVGPKILSIKLYSVNMMDIVYQV